MISEAQNAASAEIEAQILRRLIHDPRSTRGRTRTEAQVLESSSWSARPSGSVSNLEAQESSAAITKAKTKENERTHTEQKNKTNKDTQKTNEQSPVQAARGGVARAAVALQHA